MIKILRKVKDEEEGKRKKRKERETDDFQSRRRKRRKEMETGLSCFSFLPNKIKSVHKQNKSIKTKI